MRDYRTKLINGKNTLVGFNNYITDEMKQSRTLQQGTTIYDVQTGRNLSKLTSRLDDNSGWNVHQEDDSNPFIHPTSVYDSNYGKRWSDKLSDHIVKSRRLSSGTEIFGKSGKKWSELKSRLDDNLGWNLLSGSKALDTTFNIKWFVNQ